MEKLGSADYTLSPVMLKVGKATALEATWACNVCGIIEPHQYKNGRWMKKKCKCELAEARAREQAELRHMRDVNFEIKTFSWLGAERSDASLLQKTFVNFNRKAQPEAYMKAWNFAKNLEGSLILYGDEYGTGKTHLLAAVCNRIRARGIASHFVTASKLFSAIQERIQHNDAYADIIKKMINIPFLVIDDVDKAKPSEFRLDTYFQVIDERTKAERPIAISTNQLDRLPEFVGGAAASRLGIKRSAVLMLPGDYRTKL